MDFSTKLEVFRLLDNSPKMEDLKEEALKQGQDSVLSSMFRLKYIDDEGKTIVDTPGARLRRTAEGWYLSKIAQAEALRRSMVAVNNIEPVTVCSSREDRESRSGHFKPDCRQSTLRASAAGTLVRAGFARFFQGDFASAAQPADPSIGGEPPPHPQSQWSRSDQAAGRRHGGRPELGRNHH